MTGLIKLQQIVSEFGQLLKETRIHTVFYLVAKAIIRWKVENHAATNNWSMYMSSGPQGRGLCWPPGELPALQLVGGPSHPPQTGSAGQ